MTAKYLVWQTLERTLPFTTRNCMSSKGGVRFYCIMALEQITWTAWVPIEKAGETADGEMLLSGPVASAMEDFDGDILEKAGIWKGLDVFDKLGGQVDWCHQWKKTQDPNMLIGRAIERKLVDDTPFLTTQLRKGLKLAQDVWQLHKDGMKLGYSIDGTGLRDSLNPKRIIQTAITMVTLAPQAKGFDQYVVEGRCPAGLVAVAKALVLDEEDEAVGHWGPIDYTKPVGGDYADNLLERLVKALETGSSIVQAGQGGGAALRRQQILPKLATASFGGQPRRKRRIRKKLNTDQLAKSLAGIGLVNAGVAAEAIRRFR